MLTSTTPGPLVCPPFPFHISIRRLRALELQLALAADNTTVPAGTIAPSESGNSAVPQLPPRPDRRRRFASDSIVLLALQDLRALGHRHGRPAMDAAVLHLCGTLLRHLRRTDILVRLHGNSFVLALLQTRVVDAFDVIEHLRRVVSSSPLPLDTTKLPLTFCAGITERRQHESLQALIARAQAALQSAKKSGAACTHWRAPFNDSASVGATAHACP